MPVNARFTPTGEKQINFDNIEGYRISAFFHPSKGFNGTFFVYIHELITSEDDLSALDLSTPSSGKKTGELSITDIAQERTYNFKNIDLITTQSFFTQEQKTRLAIFQYRDVVTNAGKYCTMENKAAALDPERSPSKMGKKYSYKIDGTPEPLLFFGSRSSRDAINIFRFGALRNKNNSFLDMIMKMDEEKNERVMKEKSIKVKNMTLSFDKDTLQGMIADESYGSFLSMNVTSLDTIAETEEDYYLNLAKINFEIFSPAQYLQHSQNARGIKHMNQDSSVETATIILKKGQLLNQTASIV
ncbi:MAG: hypothetical protein QM737_01205 [Ferruginibacter sp.]